MDTEKEILEFWDKKDIYKKSRKKNSNGKKFYMMDGPPYATGNIHMGTALNKILKDIAMRTRRLQGFNVFDRPGYDTHGVPIEFKIEKEIGSKSKQDIEKYGVKKFIEKCKEFATRYIDIMNKEFKNLGVWMDFDNPYLTLSDKYVESIWDTFKVAEEKNLLYLGKYPIHACPRCETAVAYNEVEYEQQKDTSIYVKFPLKESDSNLIIWTTTPWTLPGNTGVMIHPDYMYQEIETSKGEKWIIAKDLIPSIMQELELGYTIKDEFKGKKLVGKEYENPLSKNLKLELNNAYKVVSAPRFVNLEEGTGLVHSAPGHGKEDFEVGKQNNLDMPSPVNIDGILTKEAGKYSGKKAREVDKEIIEDLEEENKLVYKKQYTHDYPVCWRCKSPLLMISQPQWFFKISEIQKQLLKENEKVNWFPYWMKLRMKAWIQGLSDWPVSRKRYWGTPLPIWVCEKCEKRKVIGSKKEIEELSNQKLKDVHKPEIDEIEIECSCRGKMKRVPDVLDVWFDSGVSSWAALKIDNKDYLKEFWPADLNVEGKDQVRGWWNSQFILSQIKFGKKPFESILEHGMVLDLGKKKMSKSQGNIIAPQDIIEQYGRDYLRYYFAKVSKGEDFGFDEKEFKEIQKTFRVLLNINRFVNQLNNKKSKQKIEDKWIISRFNSLIRDVKEDYNNYKFYSAINRLEKFLIEDLSKTYIQIIRDRADETSEILNFIRIGLIKLFAPITPFITEKTWQELKENNFVEEESVHLALLPKEDNKKINSDLEQEFDLISQVIEKGLALRDKNKVGLRWPLKKVTINYSKKIDEEFYDIIKSQLNVKEVEFKKSNKKEIEVDLDFSYDKELEAEGYARELSRKVQAFRKKLGLQKEDLINLYVFVEEELKEILEKQEKLIKERTNSKKLEILPENSSKKETFKNKESFKIKEKKGGFAIETLKE